MAFSSDIPQSSQSSAYPFPCMQTTENISRLGTPESETDLDVDAILDDTIEFLSTSDIDKLLSSSPMLGAAQLSSPIQTPPSSIGPAYKSSTYRRKRVDFAPFTSGSLGWGSRARANVLNENTSALSLRRSQPLNDSFPPKSILKATRNLDNILPQSPQTSEMEPAWSKVVVYNLKRLATEDKAIRLDAWRCMHQLASQLQPPLHQGLEEQYIQLARYGARDMQYTDDVPGLPTQLPLYTLRLLSTITTKLSKDACSDLVAASVGQLSRVHIPKSLVARHLEFLSRQNTAVLGPSLVRQIIHAVHTAGQHQSKMGIVIDQITLYRQLAEQCPERMALSASDWMDDLLQALLANESEVFVAAVDTSFTIAHAVGHHKDVAAAFRKVVETKEDTEGGKTKFESLVEVLNTKSDITLYATEAEYIPKMFSGIALFLQHSGPSNMLQESWKFKALIDTLKPYFGRLSANSHKAQQALTAWSWFIVAETHGGRWPPKSTKTLREPLVHILKASEKSLDFSKGTPRYIVSTYLLLLYCTIYPGLQADQLSKRWNLYIKDVLGPMLKSKSSTHVRLVAEIISAILASPAIHDVQLLSQSTKSWCRPVMQIEKLPRIDPAWVLSNLSLVLETVDSILQKQPSLSLSVQVWDALMDSLASAGANEVIATRATKEAIAFLTTYLTQLWRTCGRSAASIVFYGKLVHSMMLRLRGIDVHRRAIFMEPILCQTQSGDGFGIATTPSHRTKNASPFVSPAAHFLDSLSLDMVRDSNGNGDADNLTCLTIEQRTALRQILYQLVEWSWCNAPTFKGQVAFLLNWHSILQRRLHEAVSSESLKLISGMCDHLAVIARSMITRKSDILAFKFTNTASWPKDLCKDDGKLMAIVTQYAFEIPLAPSFFIDYLHDALGQWNGQIGTSNAYVCITEPMIRDAHGFLRAVNDSGRQLADSSTVLEHLITILASVPPKLGSVTTDRDLLHLSADDGRPRGGKPTFESVYELINETLLYGYDHLLVDSENTEQNTRFLATILRLLKSHDRKQDRIALSYITKMQHGLIPWIEDRKDTIFGSSGSTIGEQVSLIWSFITSSVRLFRPLDKISHTTYVNSFSGLMLASFRSGSTHIVQSAVSAWNETLGQSVDLAYPPKIAKALRRLQNADITVAVAASSPLELSAEPDSPFASEVMAHGREEGNLPNTCHAVHEQTRQTSLSPKPVILHASWHSTAATPTRELTQAQFEPVPFSPLPQRDEDVRDHQPALFPVVLQHIDIVSTRDDRSAEQHPPQPSTPLLGPTLDDGIPSSSPVVASVRRRESSVRRASFSKLTVPKTSTEIDDVPSSPPAMDIVGPLQSALDTSSHVFAEGEGPLACHVRMEHKDTLVAPTAHVDADSHLVENAARNQGIEPSFGSISSAYVEDSFIVPNGNVVVRQAEETGEHSVSQQQGAQPDLEIAFSQSSQLRRKRKHRGTTFTSSKRRKSLKETERCIARPRNAFVPPPDMYDEVTVYHPDWNVADAIDNEINIPATDRKTRGRFRRSTERSARSLSERNHNDETITRQASGSATNTSNMSLPRTRDQSRKSSKVVSPLSDFHTALTSLTFAGEKRRRVSPTTPSNLSRSSSVHYVQITPGNAQGRRRKGTKETETPEAEARVRSVVSQRTQDTVVRQRRTQQDAVIPVISSTTDATVSYIFRKATQPSAMIPQSTRPGQQHRSEEPTAEQMVQHGSCIQDQAKLYPAIQAPANALSPQRQSPGEVTPARSEASSQISTESVGSSFSFSGIINKMEGLLGKFKVFWGAGDLESTAEVLQSVRDEADGAMKKLDKKRKATDEPNRA